MLKYAFGIVALRHMSRGILLRWVLSLVFAGVLWAGDSTNPPLAILVSSETAPSGSWTQLKVFLSPPASVSSGSIAMDLDPAVFGDIASVAVFSPNGDAQGYANVSHQHVDAHFYSPSGWLGAMPDVPVFAVWVPVLASAVAGATTAVTIDPAGSTLFDPAGNEYSMTITPGTFTVGGSLAIESVTPGGGVVPAGTPIQIMGTGFDAATGVSIDGASVARTEYVSSRQINVTLNAPVELTGRHFRVVNGAGEHLDYFSAFSSAPLNAPDGFVNDAAGVQPLVPLPTISVAQYLAPGPFSTSLQIALLNPNLTPADVAFVGGPGNLFPFGSGVLNTLTIPPGALYFVGAIGLEQYAYLLASEPIRILGYSGPSLVSGLGSTFVEMLNPTDLGNVPAIHFHNYPAPDSVAWSWQSGPAPPAPATLSYNIGFEFSSVDVPWLSVTPSGSATAGNATFSITPAAASLKPGTYTTTLTVTPVLTGVLAGLAVDPSEVNVTLTVTATAQLEFDPDPGAWPLTVRAGDLPTTRSFSVISNGQKQEFNAFVDPGTGSWLSVTPHGTTPATVQATVNPAGLAPGKYVSGFTVYGLNNTLYVPVTLQVFPADTPPPPYTGPLKLDVSSLDLTLFSGTVSTDKFVGVYPDAPTSMVIATPSGGNWLTAVYLPNQSGLDVKATAAGLAAGTYLGTITVSSGDHGPAQLTVNLKVLAIAPGTLSVTPARLSLSGPQFASGVLTLSSGAGSLPVTIETKTPAGDMSLIASATTSTTVNSAGQFGTPATVEVDAYSPTPGVHSGRVIITSPNGSVTVPVTLTVPVPDDEASWLPVMADVASAADHLSGAISPGEIAMILGTWIGPAPTNMEIGGDGKVTTTLNGTQVLIDGVPAPLIYADHNLINLIVPYETPTSGFAHVQVMTNGQETATWGVPVEPSAPAIFTLTETGLGQAAVLNADNTVNGSTNPAARGTPVQIFATGEGQTTPAGITGELTQLDLKKPLLPVRVTIGGIDAKLDYFGSAPDAVAGLLQVNAVVPAGVTPGPAVPVVLMVGDARSPDGVTIAVK
jgi:uncharacterized protein (TIGR03437 family)